MALNLQYIPAPSLQEGFLDKSTGLPLSFGLVFFYSDVNRTTLKPIYTLSGSPPNYTYTQLPNPVILSGIGTIQDGNGNDVIPYFFPFDANGNTELYYIVVTDQFGVQQFTRQGFPNVGSNVTPIIANFSENFIPNGQFLLWNPPASYSSTKYTFNFGGIIGSTDVIDVAPGGWTFQVTAGSTTTYTISFNQLLAAVLTPPASPRYEIEIIRSSPTGADNICDLRIRFMDVNKFQSTGVNDTWTLLFNAEAASTLTNVTIHLIKYFGTSGSSATPADVTEDIVWGGPINITTSQQTFAVANSFGINTGKTIGNNNNDFIEFAIRFPASALQTFNVKLTDFVLVNQNITQSQAASVDFPATTNGEFVLQALSNLAPTSTSSTTTNYYQEDGSNLFLPMIMTQKGYTYDYGEIGNIIAKTSTNNFTGSISNDTNELICDGASYKSAAYSPLGIPYRRLFNKLYDSNNTQMPMAGTGANFVSGYVLNNLIMLTTNQVGLQTVASNGAPSPGFTYQTNILGVGGSNFKTYSNSTGNTVIAVEQTRNLVTNASAGTSGMTVVQISNTPATYSMFSLIALSAAALGNGAGVGKYFDYYHGVGAANGIRLWFKTATESAPPAGGLTLVQLNLDISLTAVGVAIIIANAISAHQVQTVTTVAGAGLAGSYFNFYANGTHYYVWYKVSGSGTDPLVAGATGIEVVLLSTDTANDVADKTRAAINSYQFAVPDLRGLFLRGNDPNGFWDAATGTNRGSVVNNQLSFGPGTFEFSSNIQHNHPGSTLTTDAGLNYSAPRSPFILYNDVDSGTSNSTALSIANDGNYESRPVNYAVIYTIKY